ncbi:hypothetical protein [Paenibacillus sp. MDMC362]|uniref:hypothetical protein n=1 Tax=Paenibacillus sp. MDMC362 TaxID=2977365 RepID=UPI0011BD9A00|nr:hypothetical protein [Paenibacillus sp. MDMC362]
MLQGRLVQPFTCIPAFGQTHLALQSASLSVICRIGVKDSIADPEKPASSRQLNRLLAFKI